MNTGTLKQVIRLAVTNCQSKKTYLLLENNLNLKLNRKYFLIYKLLNSSFTGLSIGILFTIYKPLEDPSIYSLGGIFLKYSLFFLAMFYEKLLNINSFFYISLLVELIMIISLFIFLIYKTSFFSIIYLLFIPINICFGGYLVRKH